MACSVVKTLGSAQSASPYKDMCVHQYAEDGFKGTMFERAGFPARPCLLYKIIYKIYTSEARLFTTNSMPLLLLVEHKLKKFNVRIVPHEDTLSSPGIYLPLFHIY
jgi:hypothetical protein